MQCAVCEDFISPNETFLQAPCEHYYCGDCITSLITACTSDELLYPPKCCNQPIPTDAIIPLLDDTLRSEYRSKQREYAVPVTRRIYCPTPDCPTFIASSESVSGDVTCYRCSARVCSMCKQIGHTGDCSNDPGILEVKALARVHQWQTCPNCYSIIERYGGCHHMTCRCTSQFCYHCGRRWGLCRC
jgi:IBR domain, a half RING-finger domain